jgi:hypothetical protein
MRGFGSEVPEGIPGAGPGADSVPACRREARLASAGAAYGAKFPKAAAKVTGDLDQLLAFYDYPAEHWVHLRTTNPIEPAQDHWRMVNAPHLVALVRAGATFINGKLAERPGEQARPEAA